ncbi:MAG: ATP-binding protein [Planctomycetota bacterium]
MSLITRVKPKFWDHTDVAAGPYGHLFNFRRIWQMTVLLTALVTIIPLVIISLINYNVTQKALESTILLRTQQFVSNTWRTVFFFLSERRSALDLVLRDHTFEGLSDPAVLGAVFQNLTGVIGGFSDLGLVDARGNQRTYVGPYELTGKNYRDQEWFKTVVEQGVHVSDVFMGYRKVPHLVIAVKQALPDGSFYVLRAALDTNRFEDLLSQLEVGEVSDVFIINRAGVLQTPSRFYGEVLDKVPIPVPEHSTETRVVENTWNGQPLIVGYAYIDDTPFIQMAVKPKRQLMAAWYTTRLELIGFLAASLTVIIVVILGVATYLVSKIYEADRKRVATLHHVEYANKMASLGRMAAGVAHEINNPLAIINEKAGLIKDLFTYEQRYVQDDKLNRLADSIIASVGRCAAITRRLLSFSRPNEPTIKPVNLREVIEEVLDFQRKEAEYRSIAVSVEIPETVPVVLSDRGKLQEIFLNLVHNAFAALRDGGRLEISACMVESDSVRIAVADNGCGIPAEDQRRIFEPFFTTRTREGGTGLGLSITQGLVGELGGTISVESRVGVGTSFFVVLPVEAKKIAR